MWVRIVSYIPRGGPVERFGLVIKVFVMTLIGVDLADSGAL
jgi:hypothetical protein